MTSQAKDIGSRLDRVINRLINLEKKSVFEHSGVRLHPSEMHLLLALAANPEINPSHLAKVLGVTKGAVSQTLARLEKKGMIERRRSSDQPREVSVYFSDSGQAVVTGFQAKRQTATARFGAWLEGLTELEAATIHRFLEQLDENLNGLD